MDLMTCSESDLQVQIADYLRLRYPNVMFHSDFGSGVKLTPGQAVKQKRQNGGRRAWPDLFIAETVWKGCCGRHYPESKITDPDLHWELVGGGLYLELKKEGETLHPGLRAKNRFKSKDGKEYKTQHLMEQADCLHDLRQRGYCAEFAIGFDKAKRIIDEYLGGNND